MDSEGDETRLQKLLADIVKEEVSDIEVDDDDNDYLIEEPIVLIETDPEDESDNETQSPTKRVKIEPFMGKDGTKWERAPLKERKEQHIIIHPSGVKPYGQQAKTILDCWSLFFSDEILNMIVENTNQHILESSGHFSRERSAKPTDLIEIKALIGLLYLAGSLKISRLNTEEIFDKKGTGVERFWTTMSRERFRFLLRYLRFENQEKTETTKLVDNLAPIRQFYETFIDNCKKCYSVSGNCAVGERLIPYRGKCNFKVFNPRKKIKYGLKVFTLVDAKTRYTLNFEIYAGNQPQGPYMLQNDPVSIVERLITPISGTQRNITCKDWLQIFPLIEKLKEHNLTFVGNIRKNTNDLPSEFLRTKGRPVGSSIFAYQRDLTIISHIPKKRTSLIIASNLHLSDNYSGPTDEKMPEIVSFYESTKLGVEIVDELCATYDVSQTARQWPVVVFYSLMNIAGVNSQIIYVSNNSNTNITRHQYLKELALNLTEDNLRRRGSCQHLPREMKERIRDITDCLLTSETSEHYPPGTRRKCYFCKKNNKTRYTCKLCKKFICLKHCEFLCCHCCPNPDLNN